MKARRAARLPGVFVDTSAWIDIVEDGPMRRWAEHASRTELGLGAAHTTDYIILEAYSFIQRNHRKDAAVRFLDIATSPNFIVHPSDAELVDRAMERARQRNLGRELSLVDWTSALVMEDHRLRYILTKDRAFGQLGFQVVE